MAKETIKGSIAISEIKRLYAEDAIIKTKCPNCGSVIKCDMSENYLNYQKEGEKVDLYFYCKACDEKDNAPSCEFYVDGMVKSATIEIEYDLDTIKKA